MVDPVLRKVHIRSRELEPHTSSKDSVKKGLGRESTCFHGLEKVEVREWQLDHKWALLGVLGNNEDAAVRHVGYAGGCACALVEEA